VRHLIRLFTLALVTFTSSSALAKTAEKPVEIVLSPYLNTALRTLQARAGDQERPFLLDTGGGGTFLSKAAAGELRLETYGRLTGYTHDGTRIDVPKASVDVSIGTFTRRGEVAVLDLASMFPGPSLGGIVSLETFAGQAITIDLAANRLWIETPSSLAARTKSAREIRARIAHEAGGATLDLFIAVEGKHGLLWFELDDGNLQPVLIAPHALAELGQPPIPSKETRSLKLPIAGLGPVDCVTASKEMIYDGLLNAQFFMDNIVTIDLKAGRVWVTSRRAS
jgi:hypothetical protein